ncbi:hypothetical protein SUGI_0792820 [Cryptomeria japonica]|nr:hypothetical protein SUGI_0792820 [Cryptomeria japonica]
MGSQTLKNVQKKFKLRGLALTIEALRAVVNFINEFTDAEDEALELVMDEIDRVSLQAPVLDKKCVEGIINLLAGTNAENDYTAGASITAYNQCGLRIIDVFLVSKFCYDPIRKMFYEFTGKLPIHGEANSKATLYRERLQLLQQRLARDRHFARPAFASDTSRSGSFEMIPIQSLIGCIGRRWIMGVISQLEDGHFFLEDLTGAIPIDLSQAISLKIGYFVENTIIVAEGELQPNGVFQIHTCGFPPLENRNVSLSVTAGLDFFGGGALTTDETTRFADLEEKAVNDMFVILSDVWVDCAETMEKVATVLDGYEAVEIVPSLFVFMGNFCSRPCNLAFHSFSELRTQFGKLGSMIAAHTRLKEGSRFLFIPGPDDAGPAKVLPRPALPNFFCEEVKKHVPNAIFSSNPCRIKFYTQEIVLFRQDMLYRMRRSCIIPPSLEETTEPFEHLVATVTHQSHLCPLPLTVQPIIWNFDHCLRLYPTPHTIVLADKAEQKAFKYTGVTCFNPEMGILHFCGVKDAWQRKYCCRLI